MDFIFELIFEIIFEGILEIGTSKKVPTPLRIFALILFIAIYIGILLVILFAAISIMKSINVFLGWLFIIFDVFLVVCIIYAIRKKLRN